MNHGLFTTKAITSLSSIENLHIVVTGYCSYRVLWLPGKFCESATEVAKRLVKQNGALLVLSLLLEISSQLRLIAEEYRHVGDSQNLPW
jgi:hypothetical protein